MAEPQQLIEEKLRFFRKAQIWPVATALDPVGWLRNFEPEEHAVALALLDAFTYFPPEMTSKILATEFHQLSRLVANDASSAGQRLHTWREFQNKVVVTYPTDERPGATDSGRTYLRRARGILELDQEQYKDPADVVEMRSLDPNLPVLFLDDFAGTGNQFCDTWHRRYDLTSGDQASFSTTSTQRSLTIYAPVLCTDRAIGMIARRATGVVLRPGHVLTEDYSAFHPHSLLWPKHLVAHAESVLRSASARAGVPMGDGSHPDDWCGFGKLGLAAALDDTIPDACLTILYWESSGWCPLMRRP